jgi:hypothetical protein
MTVYIFVSSSSDHILPVTLASGGLDQLKDLRGLLGCSTFLLGTSGWLGAEIGTTGGAWGGGGGQKPGAGGVSGGA